MPALPDAAGIVRVQLNFQVGSDTHCLSRFYLHYSGTAPTSAQLTTFAASVRSAFGTNLKALMSSNNQLIGVECMDLSTNTGAVGTDLTAVVGTRAGSGLPGSAAVHLQFLVARRYRGGKPGIYLPFGTAADIASAQTWGSAFTSSCISGWVAFLTAIEAAGWTSAGTLSQTNVSYYDGFSVVTNPVTGRARNVPTLRGTPLQDDVRGITSTTSISSQRRRNRL